MEGNPSWGSPGHRHTCRWFINNNKLLKCWWLIGSAQRKKLGLASSLMINVVRKQKTGNVISQKGTEMHVTNLNRALHPQTILFSFYSSFKQSIIIIICVVTESWAWVQDQHSNAVGAVGQRNYLKNLEIYVQKYGPPSSYSKCSGLICSYYLFTDLLFCLVFLFFKCRVLNSFI